MAVTKHWCPVLLVCVLTTACGRDTAPAAEPLEPEALSVTRWTTQTELFAEYPPLTVGTTSRFAIHLTRLQDFKALTEGSVEVELRGSGGAETFRVQAPSRPGIFGVDVRPTRAGTRELVIRVTSSGLRDQHQVGPVHVHPDVTAARRAQADGGADDEAPGISFLKEQQWTLDFGTALVEERALVESLAVPARIVPRASGDARVLAPIDGRLTRVADLAVGERVRRGDELARVLPAVAAPGEFPQLQRDREEAASALAFARRDRERAERLIAAGAAPEKRLDQARTIETQAHARLRAAQASVDQYESVRGGTGAAGTFSARAPIDGVVAARSAATGATVTRGAELFHIVDPAQVHVIGQIPETHAATLAVPSRAEVEVPGRDGRIAVGRLITTGRVLDAQTRTLPITFAFDNRRAAVPVGQAVTLFLATGGTTPHAVVPAAAIVDDAGRPIVFVQREGETFERRAVTVGARQGDHVQILEGVQAGERVVFRGAYLVRLAALSTSVPSHGHVH